MKHDDFKRLQNDMVDKVLGILKADDMVLGISICGSMANGTNDAFSDIDLQCYLRSNDHPVVDNIITQIQQINPVLCKLWLYNKNALFLFNNGLRLDLDLLSENVLENLNITDYKILYDPHGELKKRIGGGIKSNPMHPKYFEPGIDLPNWYFWMFRQVYCWTKRGAQNGNHAFDKLYSAFNSLNEMRQYLIDMRKWTLGRDGYLNDIDYEFTIRLQKTFPSLVPEEILNATRLLLSEYEYVCKDYCKKCNVAYPKEKVEITKSLFDMFDKLT